jgi:PST family polysaccharide transporter
MFGMVNYAARNLDDLLIGRLFGERALGLYGQSYRILDRPIRGITAPIGAVAISSLSRLTSDPSRYRRAFLRILEKILMISTPLAAFVVGTGNELVIAMFGPSWSEAGPIAAWLGLLIFTQPIGAALGWLLITQNRTDELRSWGFIGSGISVLSFLVGLPWGPTGVAAAYAASGVAFRLPLLVRIAGSRGLVSIGSLVHTALPHAIAALAAIVAVLMTRFILLGSFWAISASPVSFCAIAMMASLVAQVGVLGASRQGRAAIADLLGTLGAFRSR